MGDYEAYTVSKENVEDDRALLTSGVIGTGTAVEKQPILDRYTHKVLYICTYKEYHSVCPLVGIRTLPCTSSLASECTVRCDELKLTFGN